MKKKDRASDTGDEEKRKKKTAVDSDEKRHKHHKSRAVVESSSSSESSSESLSVSVSDSEYSDSDSERRAAHRKEAKKKAAAKKDGGEEDDSNVIKTPFGTFIVGDKIGRGAFAQVYKAFWKETEYYVAVKQFDTSQMPEETVESVLMEVNLLGSLNHPNILRILGYHRDEESLYLMLEYAEEGSLLDLVKETNGLPEDLVAVYTAQVLKALAYLHSCGVIHRDLKAANILLTKKGEVKLADFGVAAVMNDADKHFTVVGSPYWMAPEIISESGHSFSSDIWSVGCTIVELLTGNPPYFDLNPMTAMFKIVQSEAPIPEECTELLKAVLGLCFQKDPSARPSAEELLQHPWFQQQQYDDSNMEISAVRAQVKQYKEEHKGSAKSNAGSDGRKKKKKSGADTLTEKLGRSGLITSSRDSIGSFGSSSRQSLREREMEREIKSLKKKIRDMDSASNCAVASETSAYSSAEEGPAERGGTAIKGNVPMTVISLKAKFIEELSPVSLELDDSAFTVTCVAAIEGRLWLGSADGQVAAYKLPKFRFQGARKLHSSPVRSIIPVGASHVWVSSEDGSVFSVAQDNVAHNRKFTVCPPDATEPAKTYDAVHSMLFVENVSSRVWVCVPGASASRIIVFTKRGRPKLEITVRKNVRCMGLTHSKGEVWLGVRGAVVICHAVRGGLKREIALPEQDSAAEVASILPIGDMMWCAAGKAVYVFDSYSHRVEKTLSLQGQVDRLIRCESIILAAMGERVACIDPISMTVTRTLEVPRDALNPQEIVSFDATDSSPIWGRNSYPKIFAASEDSGKLCMWRQQK